MQFISEIICTFVLSVFYDKSMLKRQFEISLGIMYITNYTWGYQILNQANLFQNWLDCYVHTYTDLNRLIYGSNILRNNLI